VAPYSSTLQPDIRTIRAPEAALFLPPFSLPPNYQRDFNVLDTDSTRVERRVLAYYRVEGSSLDRCGTLYNYWVAGCDA
jgi:hypothetical protein